MTLLRPKFNEGQVLSAGDLGRGVDYARYADAVHSRSQHTWGVVVGLDFRLVDQTTSNGDAYKDVYLKPGIAIDASGRRIVVDAEQLVSAVQFNNDGIAGSNEKDVLYPVYVLAVDQPQASSAAGACASTSPTRVAETYQIQFGRPGSEEKPLKPTEPRVGDGPGTGLKVLVGYVAWNPSLAGGKFTDVKTVSKTGAVRYAGVRAAQVLAPAGSVVLETRASGKHYALSLAEDGNGGCKLQFGTRTDDGAISETMVITEKGDFTVSGKLDVKLPTASVAEAGVIYHGLRVPLPPGVTQDAIDSKQFTAHVVVSPAPLGVLVTGGKTYYPVWLECRVVDRRVISKVMWRDVGNAANYRVGPAACQYLVVASPTK